MTATAQAAPARARRGALASRDFARLWLGESISLIGTQITQLALPLTAVLTLHATVLQVGFLSAVRYVPVIGLSLAAGVWLDRRRRRPVLIAADAGCAVCIGLIPLAYALGGLSIGLLFALAALAGAFQATFDIGCLSYLPGLVDPGHLADANGKLQISYSAAQVAGPTLAGLLVGILTAPVTLTADAGTYLCSLVMLLLIRRREPDPRQDGPAQPVRAAVAEGLRSVFGSALLRSLLAQSCAFNFVMNALVTVFVVYAVRSLGLSATKLGLVIGAGAVAAVAAAAAANRLRTRFGLGRTLTAATLGGCLSPLLLLVPRDAGATSLVILGAAHAILGASAVVFNVATVTLRQAVTPSRLLARMNGSYRMLLWGAFPLGALFGGAAGTALGLRAAMVITTAAATLPAAWIFFSPVFRLTQLPSQAAGGTDTRRNDA